MKRYEFTFDPWAFSLFLLVMAPNFIWFAVPAPNDVLRRESVTPAVDSIASVCQVLMVAALCVIANRERKKPRPTPLTAASVGCILVYYAGWIFYYLGRTDPAVILLLTVPPCLAFIFFAVDRKNDAALVPAGIFAVCHLIYGVVNFMI